MNIEEFRACCLQKKGASESLPFGNDTLVFKVVDKIFALADITLFESINLKCAPEQAILLREQYKAVQPGYHMNKKHWNTILMDNTIPDHLLQQWIDDSYDLVVQNLPAKARAKIL